MGKELGAMDKELGAMDKELGARSKEQRVGSMNLLLRRTCSTTFLSICRKVR